MDQKKKNKKKKHACFFPNMGVKFSVHSKLSMAAKWEVC